MKRTPLNKISPLSKPNPIKDMEWMCSICKTQHNFGAYCRTCNPEKYDRQFVTEKEVSKEYSILFMRSDRGNTINRDRGQ